MQIFSIFLFRMTLECPDTALYAVSSLLRSQKYSTVPHIIPTNIQYFPTFQSVPWMDNLLAGRPQSFFDTSSRAPHTAAPLPQSHIPYRYGIFSTDFVWEAIQCPNFALYAFSSSIFSRNTSSVSNHNSRFPKQILCYPRFQSVPYSTMIRT
jgi:hypothetical protein